MNVSISGTANSGGSGGEVRIDFDQNGSGPTTLWDYRDGASGGFSATLVDFGDKIVAARFKPGGSVSGTASATAAASQGCKILYKPNGADPQVLLTVAAGGSGGTSFSFASQGDSLSVEHA